MKRLLWVGVFLATAGLAFALGRTPKDDGSVPRVEPAPEPGQQVPGGVDAAVLPAGVPRAWWSEVQESLRGEDYAITWRTGSSLPDESPAFVATNRAQGFQMAFLDQGVRLAPWSREGEAWEWGLTLVPPGEAGDPATARADAADPVLTRSNRIEYDRGWVTEWYVNSPEGLEQGFTLPAPVAGSGVGSQVSGVATPEASPLTPHELRIDLALHGNLRPVFSEDGQAIDFYRGGGFPVLRYAGLLVTDAAGETLAARFEAIPGGLSIVVDDRDALYPVTVDPMLTTPSWSAESNVADGELGFAVSCAGDVNGDGYSDVLVKGALNTVYCYHGSASGLPPTPNWTATFSARPWSVSSAGDVNGDGFSDVIVGVYSYSNGQSGEGAAFAYYGSASGLAAAASWSAESDQTDAHMGCSVSTAGDANGDGYSDVIVGARGYDDDQVDEGRATVYYGSASGLSAAPGWTRFGNQTACDFGQSVSTAGDVNGDGYSDVIVGAPDFDNGQNDEGIVRLFLGSNKGLQSVAWTGECNQAGAAFGYSAATAGDVNGDGYSDVIVGAFYYTDGQTDEGAAFVFHGSSGGLSSTAAWIGQVNQMEAYFGSQVASAGDVNGDGFADVIISASWYDNGQGDEGAAFVYYGSASGVRSSYGWMFDSNQVFIYMGMVAGAGDVNGDGFSDVIVGAYRYSNGQTGEGAAFVFHGSALNPLDTASWTAEGDQPGATLGCSVGTAGDVNGDGYGDVIVGAYRYANGETEEGAAFVYYGSASGLSATPDWSAEGNQTGAFFGHSVATAGDVNGDGYADVLVGAYTYDNGQANEGAVFLYLGSAAGLSATPAWMGESNQAGAYYGWSVSTAGDVNGDGHSDVIVGANYYSNGVPESVGAAFVYHGSLATGLSAEPDWSVVSTQEGAHFGESVSTAGDVNFDGFSDVIVGASLFDDGQTDEGAAFVYCGSATGLSATPYWMGQADQESAYYGTSVSGAGHLHGTEYACVVVGAPSFSNGQSEEGRAYVYRGSLYGLQLLWTGESDQAYAQFGMNVKGFGDVNGDGFADIVVGAPHYDNGQADEGRVYLYYGSGLGPSASWTAESDLADAGFGFDLAIVGDVNGDGSADVFVGAPMFNGGAVREGRASLYCGNGGDGVSVLPRQSRPDFSHPIVPALWSYDSNTWGGRLQARSSIGRALVRVQFQWGEGISFTQGAQSDWTDVGGAGALLTQVMDNYRTDKLCAWRARIQYHPKYGTPLATRWFYQPYGSKMDPDLRLGLDPLADGDGDGEPNATDCFPADPTLWSEPEEDLSLFKITQSGTDMTFTWVVPPAGAWGSTAVTLDVMRSDTCQSFDWVQCIASDLDGSATAAAYTDPSIWTPGDLKFYIVRIENACGYEMGERSDGTPRVGTYQCPPP